MTRAGGCRAALSAIATLLAAASPVLAQCRMCRTDLDSPEALTLAGAFQRRILVLLPVPFLLVAIIAVLALRSRRTAANVEEPRPQGYSRRHPRRTSG